MIRETMWDPMSKKSYDYIVRDDKEGKLLEALKMSLEDKCPPDRKDYLCFACEDDDQRCDECWLRWATKDFGVYRK